MESDFVGWIKNNLSNLRIKNNPPPSEDEVSKLEKESSFTFPQDYRELLLHSNGTTFYSDREVFSFFDVEDVSLLNDDPVYSENLEKGFFIIGNDNGDNLYVFDRNNNWGNGKMALYRMDSGSLMKSTSQYLGANLREVLTKLKDGISFSRLPYLDNDV